jgi:hypothetical protein
MIPSDKAQKLPYKFVNMAYIAIDAAVRKQRPDLSERHYLYLVEEVYQIIQSQEARQDALPKPLPDLETMESEFIKRVEACLTQLEIRTGQLVLYEKVLDQGC